MCWLCLVRQRGVPGTPKCYLSLQPTVRVSKSGGTDLFSRVFSHQASAPTRFSPPCFQTHSGSNLDNEPAVIQRWVVAVAEGRWPVEEAVRIW